MTMKIDFSFDSPARQESPEKHGIAIKLFLLIDYLNKRPLNFLFCSIFINNVLVFCNTSGLVTPSIRVLALCHLEGDMSHWA